MTQRWIERAGKSLLVAAFFLTVQLAEAADPPVLYLFWGEGCPHCEKEKTFRKNFHQQYPEVEFRLFETWKNPEFAKFANEVRKAYQIKGASVPLTVMGDWYMVGFSSSGNYSQQIIAQAETCLRQGCPDVLDKLGPSAIAAHIRQEIKADAPKGWDRYPAVTSHDAAEDEQDKIIVSYFHGNEDCPVCDQVEQAARQTVEEGFQDALKAGRIEFRRLNAEDPENRTHVERYGLTARAVIVSQMVKGRELQWKPLDKIWILLDDNQALREYVRTEIQSYMQKNQ